MHTLGTSELEAVPNLLDIFEVKLWILGEKLWAYLGKIDIPSGPEPTEKLLRVSTAYL